MAINNLLKSGHLFSLWKTEKWHLLNMEKCLSPFFWTQTSLEGSTDPHSETLDQKKNLEFTVLPLHFLPLATFDSLGGPFSLSSVVLSLFFPPLLCHFPFSPWFCCCPPPSLSALLPSLEFVEVRLPAAWESAAFKSPTPTVKSVHTSQTPRPPPTPAGIISSLQCIYLMYPVNMDALGGVGGAREEKL